MPTVADPATPYDLALPAIAENPELRTEHEIDWATLHPDLIIGVDTHRDTHTAVAITGLGAVLGAWTVGTDSTGLSDLFTHVTTTADHTADHTAQAGGVDIPQIVWAIEGSASYGAGLREFLRATDPDTVMIEATNAGRNTLRGRKNGAKNDTLDAENIARDALAQLLNYQQSLRPTINQHDHHRRGRSTHRPPATPRQGGTREAISTISTLRAANVATATHRTNQFKALLIKSPETLRARYRGLSSTAQLTQALHQREPKPTGDAGVDAHARTAAAGLKQLARQIRDLKTLIAAADQELIALTRTHAPRLLDIVGLGPVGAAIILGVWSHPGRIHSEAHFASLAGAAPLPVTSGAGGHRHRLNRGGDRALHNVCWRVVQTRIAMRDPRTVAYLQRRLHEGKTRREAVRCLIRYVVRQIWRTLQKETPHLP